MPKYFAQKVYVTTTAQRRSDQHQNQLSTSSSNTHHQSHHRPNRNATSSSANNTSSCDSIVAEGSDDDNDSNYLIDNSNVGGGGGCEIGGLSTLSSTMNANSNGGIGGVTSNKMHQQKISSHLLDHGYGATPQSYYPKESKVIPKTSSDGGCITNYYKVS